MNRENRAFECDAITAAWNAKKLWALQVLGSIALLLGTYGWLRIPDAKVLQVGFTAVLAIILVMAFLWLEAGTLAYFHQTDSENDPPASAFRQSHVLAFAVSFAIFACLMWSVLSLNPYLAQFAGWQRHVLPQAVRTRISPRTVFTILSIKWFVLFWIIVPAVFLPFMSQAAANGFLAFAPTGLRHAGRAMWHLRYWIGYILLFFLGGYLPYELVWWQPQTNGLWSQATNMGIRFIVAYLLAITCWLLLASLLGRFSAEGPASASSVTTSPVVPAEPVASL